MDCKHFVKTPYQDRSHSFTSQKGPKFAPAPSKIPYKEIVANIEAGIENLADDTKELVRNAAASTRDKAQLPANNVSKQEKKSLIPLEKRRIHCNHGSRQR